MESTVSGCTERGAPNVVFVHGWPDGPDSAWRPVLNLLEPTHRCVTVTLPGYDGADLGLTGHSFERLGALLAGTIRRECGEGGANLLVHDWGSHVGFQCEEQFPELVQKMVVLDVGPPQFGGRKRNWKLLPGMLAMGFAYQYWLILALLISRVPIVGPLVGDLLARTVAWLTRWGSGLTGADRAVPPGITAASSYPYLNFQARFFRDLLHGAPAVALPRRPLATTPNCAVLFAYGAAKGFAFHAGTWERAVRARTDGSAVQAWDDCEHWLQLQHPERVAAAASAFFATS